MTEPKADVSLELLTKIAALFAIYLIAQGYGYAYGSTTEPPENLYDAISHGVFHMKSFLRPWDVVAWPLSPFLCGLMLVYAPYLPSQLREEPGSMAAKVNRSFFALFLAVSLVHITAVWVSDWGWFIEKYAGPSDAIGIWGHILRNALYAMSYAFWYALFLRLFGDRKRGFAMTAKWASYPWPEIMTTLVIIWIIFLAYTGAEWDGAHDGRLEAASQAGMTENRNLRW